MSRTATVERTTKESDIVVAVDLDNKGAGRIDTSLPFLDHMLTACSFHGGFQLTISASGDIQVDPHHVVEDVGLVMGSCFEKIFRQAGPIARFGHSVLPMDEALSETTIDVCGRPTLVYQADFPQQHSGEFGMWLFREFFSGFVMTSKIALHAECRYGENAHHMIEALFKAFGKSLAQAYAPITGDKHQAVQSTKGVL